MGTVELISTLDEGVREGRIAPYLADFIAAQALNVSADEVGFSEWGSPDRDVLSRNGATTETLSRHQ